MKHDILNYLPKYTTFMETPDLACSFYSDDYVEVKAKTCTIKTKDLVSAFMSIQRDAIKNADKMSNAKRRDLVIQKIKRMTYF